MKREEIIRMFPDRIRRILQGADWRPDQLQEIRLRTGKPLLLLLAGREYFLSPGGMASRRPEGAYLADAEDIRRTMEYLGQYSLYAYEEELRQGFLTVQGGHRVGVAGKIVLEKNRVKGISHISGINVRFSHQIRGCADAVMPYVISRGNVCHTLIISPPRCGKTTLLRDLIRQISNGCQSFPGCTVGVVDERSELGGSYLGVPQNDLGIRTDVLDGCLKAEGMMMLIRAMSPAVVAVDELGDYEDIHAIEMTLHSGCKLLATVHGSSIEDIQKKPLLERLIKEHTFERYILLRNGPQGQAGEIGAVFDGRGSRLDGGREA